MSGQRQLQSSILEISDTFVEAYRVKDKYINSFLKAKSLNDQILAVKTISLEAVKDPEVLQFLSDLYFNSPINHAVRNQIAKIIDKHNEVLTNYIKNSIESLMSTSKEGLTCAYKNTTVVSLSGCFQNFSQGKEALKSKCDEFLVFLCESLENYLENLSYEYSPSLRNDLFLYIHNAIRVIISCVQEFAHVIELTSKQIEFIKNSSKKLINSNDTLMDTKTNLGILIAYIARVSEDYNEHITAVSKLINSPNEDCEKLCKCIGIINTFLVEDFQKHPKEIIIITKIISSVAHKYSSETNMYLAATRSLKHLSKTLLLFENIENIYMENILEILIDYSLLYVEHDLDCIRHMCKDMLRNIVLIFKKFELNGMMDAYYKTCFSIKSITKKCLVLCSIASVVDCKEILQKYPDIFKNLFKDNVKDTKVNNLYEMLMVKSYNEIDYLTWRTIWIDFLLNLYDNENNADYITCIENLFNKAVHCDVQILNILLNYNVRLSTKFSVLWTVRKNGLIVDNFQNLLSELRSNFKLVFISNCEDTKIMALRLLIETHKSTELITEVECENILLFLIYNSNLQNPSSRSKALRLLIKLLDRLEVNLDIKFKQPEEKEHLFKFLKELLPILSGNLFLGANFSRRSFCLTLLKHTIQILIKRNLNTSMYLPINFTNIIFEILHDPYSVNKSEAVEILNFCKTKTEVVIYESSSVLESLLISVRPSDSLTAAYHLEHICNIFNLKETKAFFNIDGNVPSIQPLYYCALLWCMKILKNGIIIANKSILLAAKLNPLYGSLTAIQHLVLKLNFKKLSTDLLWKYFLTELIDICKIASDIVKPIVNNCSPEGHLPNDFTEYIEEELKNEKKYDSFINNKSDQKDLKVTSQMILLCAWRTIKEVCTILGEIVLRTPFNINLTQSQNILEIDQICAIGEQFKELLLETKHRGAFELAYTGFFKLCKFLWKVNYTELNALPMKWLKELLNIIVTDSIEYNKICATRRGAGIPFMVQALVTSELELKSTCALEFCMPKLFEVCNEHKFFNFVSRTHAFNILRALYRCKDLNNVISEYIADGVIFAIRGYNCSTWSEKNSATLLFSALIVRIFGVQETKDPDHLNIKNKLTGRIFFLRYSKLYDFFLEELKVANKLIDENKPVNNLQPILLIFCRLYGSALEGTDSNLKLNIFIPLICKCSGSRDMHTRLLAAKAVSSIVPLDMLENQIINILASYRCAMLETRLSLNYVHGVLLQVKYLVIYVQKLSSAFIENILNELNYIENRSQNIVVLKTILDIKIDILERIPEIHNFTICLQKFCSPLNFPDSLNLYYPVFRQSIFIYNCHILKLQLSESLLLSYLLNSTEEETSIEQTDAILSIIVLITFNKSSQRNEIIDELEIFDNEIKLIEILSIDSVEKLHIELISSKKIQIFLKRIIKNCKYQPKCIKKAYAILSQIGKCPFNLREIILESQIQHEDTKATISLCVERLIMEYTYDDDNNLNDLFEYLICISQSSATNLLRLRSSRILEHLSKYFNTYIEKKFEKIAINFACVLLTLLNDDDPSIRNNVSNIVLTINSVYHLPLITDIVSNYAQVVFIENIANTLKKYYQVKDNAFIRSIFIGIINFQLEEHKTANQLNTEDIFYKNEENIYAESAKVIFDCKQVFFKYFGENI